MLNHRKNEGMDIAEFIKTIADDKVDAFFDAEHAVPGNNGAYMCEDTPVRNTAHWCVIYSYLALNYSEKKYYDLCRVFGDYIVDIQNKSLSGSVECISEGSFDKINGLIGQAWAIEGLLAAYRIIKSEKYLDAAEKIFKSQIFDSESGYWKRVDMDGNDLGYDLVFNHQIWFAAVGAELTKYRNDPEIIFQVSTFVKCLGGHFKISPKGRIKHFGDFRKKKTLKYVIKSITGCILPYGIWRYSPDKLRQGTYEDSYQLFNLYAFAILYNNGFKDNTFFLGEAFKKALEYGLDFENLNRVFNVSKYEYYRPDGDVQCRTAKFSYAYNSPAFEYGYVVKTFTSIDGEKETHGLLEIQNNLCYNERKRMYSRNTKDANTLTARIYELIRYLEMQEND